MNKYLILCRSNVLSRVSILLQIVSANFHASRDVVCLEKSSSFFPYSGLPANLQSGKVRMKGSCHRLKYNFLEELN